MKFLVIGAGSMGKRRTEILAKRGHAVSVYDIDNRKLAFAHKLGAEVLVGSELPNAFQNCDGVLVCTHPDTHISYAMEAALRGKPFFIEKPLCMDLDSTEMAELVQTAQETGAWGMMGQSYRFLPSLQKFGKKFDHRQVYAADIWQGQHLADWHPEEDHKKSYSANPRTGGVVRESFAHSFDIANWLLGEFKWVVALVSNTGALGISASDTATAMIRMQSGAQVVVHNDFLMRPRQFRINVYTLSRGTNWYQWVFDHTEMSEAYREETCAFALGCQKQLQMQPDLFQGIKIAEWLEAAEVSSQQGEWENIYELWRKVSNRVEGK